MMSLPHALWYEVRAAAKKRVLPVTYDGDAERIEYSLYRQPKAEEQTRTRATSAERRAALFLLAFKERLRLFKV